MGINSDGSTADPSALLDVKSTDKGILIPRLTSQQRQNISNPATGLLVFDSDTKSFWFFNQGWTTLGGSGVGVFEKQNNTVRPVNGYGTDNFIFGRADLPGTSSITDTLFFFDHAKGAFRGGITQGTQLAPLKIGVGSFAFGNRVSAPGAGSVAFGGGLASGDLSMAIGDNAEATGQNSFAFGSAVEASGDYSIASGVETYAQGNFALAFGSESEARKDHTVALGFENRADGVNALTLGTSSTVNSDKGIAIGNSILVRGQNQISLGQFNNPIVSPNAAQTPTSPLLTIGNGDNNFTRNNAMTILKNGNIGVGEDAPKESIHLNGAIVIGNTNNTNPESGTVRFNGTELQTYNGSTWVSFGSDNLGNHEATQALNMDGEEINNIAPPIDFDDAANKAYVDAHQDGDASQSNELITNVSLSNTDLIITEAGVDYDVDLSSLGKDNLGNHIATQELNMNVKKITNLASPNFLLDAANKIYVDQHEDDDASTSNELITGISLNNTTLTVAEGASSQNINLAPLQDDLGDHIADQTLNMALHRIINMLPPQFVNDAATKGYVDAHTDADASAFNEIQSLSFSNGTLSISSGNSVSINGSNTLIEDNDGDTRITTETALPDSDIIQMEIQNKQILKIFDRFPLSTASLGVIEFLNNRGNILIGFRAGEDMNTPITDNILIGDLAGRKNRASGAVYIGREAGALASATLPNSVCIGYKAGSSFGPASNNTFIGYESGLFIVEGNNTFLGAKTGGTSSLTERSTIIGANAAASLDEGTSVTIVGYNALPLFTDGTFNTALGSSTALDFETGTNNTFIGFSAGNDLSNGSLNTFVGNGAKAQNLNTTYNNSMALGNDAVISANAQIRVGNGSITSIGGNRGWTNLSDGRFKTNVKSDVPGLAFINKLNPVTYHLEATKLHTYLTGEKPSNPITKEGLLAREKETLTGFIAQEVEATALSLGYEFSGVDQPKNKDDHYGLRYATFVVPLVKAVQELSEKNVDLKKQLETTNKALKLQQKQYDRLLNEIEDIKKMLEIKTLDN